MVRKDYYLILGVSRTESPNGIRAAFRELAKRYHPEHVGPQGARFFQEILTAYQVLSNPEKRKHYDQGLFHAEGREVDQGRPISVGTGTPLAPLVPALVPILKNFAVISPFYEEVCAQVHRSFTPPGVPREEPAKSVNLQLVLSPDEAARGGIAVLKFPVFYPCSTCGGVGRDRLFPCTSCEAQGMKEEEELVRIQIPPMVHDYTLREIPLRGLGIHNLYLRLYLRVMP